MTNLRWMLCVLVVSSPLLAGTPSNNHAEAGKGVINGYERTIRGGTLTYASCQPDANSALLVRSQDAGDSMEWETSPVPADGSEESVTFAWIFGLNANLEVRTFHLSVNGEEWLEFHRPADSATGDWSVAAANGAELRFHRTLVDKHGDLFGYAFLRVPMKLLERGKPLRLRVAGESVGSRAWYMTFEHRLAGGVSLTPQQAILREGTNGLQPVAVDVVHLSDDAPVTLSSPGTQSIQGTVHFGFNRFIMKFPATSAPRDITVSVDIDGTAASYHALQTPVRKWTVYMVEHAHTDIGYTRPQTDILADHVRFIDYALDYCDLTDGFPEDAKFRWTCEASWPVREYLRTRPAEQIERLKKRVQEGRIEVTAMMFNMSDLADENSYVPFFRPVKGFHDAGIPVVTAMQDDVNGAAWCITDYLHDIGVRYLTMGQNADRALKPFSVPTPFWWVSPSGKRLLVYRSDHYMTGNFMSIERGRLNLFEPELFSYLAGMERSSYRFDRIAVQYSGYFTDNSAPSMTGANVIKQWNEKYLWPHLRSAVDHEFPEYVEKTHGSDLQTLRGGWPDWWDDGIGSAAREAAVVRATQADMATTEGLFSIARLKGASLPLDMFGRLDAIHDALLFYNEHTYGAAESISDPRVENSVVQWSEKAAYAWDAVKASRSLRESAMGTLQQFLPRADVPTITVFNTLNWARSGVHAVYIDHQMLPPDRQFRIVDADGRDVPVQLISRRADGSTWGLWVTDVPALGFKTYRIDMLADTLVREQRAMPCLLVLENNFYRITIDSSRGAIASIIDKQLRKELLDQHPEWKCGEYVYETLRDRERLAQFGMPELRRSGVKNPRITCGSSGSLWESVIVYGRVEGCTGDSGIQCEIRLFKETKRIELQFTARKLPVFSPEGAYVAFPWALPGARIVLEAQGGVLTPGIDQVPRSSADWLPLQSFVAARSQEGQILLASNEIPLVQCGGLNVGRYQPEAPSATSLIYSWVFNNYWTTNFVAAQDGELKWSYAITSTADTSNTAAERFGWATRIPFASRVLPPGESRKGTSTSSYLQKLPGNILLTNVVPARDGSGIILHFRELDGIPAEIDLKAVLGERARYAQEVNVLEEQMGSRVPKIEFAPFESKFVKCIIP